MSIKVMFAPLNYGDIKQDGVYDAFTDLGCELQVYDYMNKYLYCKNPKKIRESFISDVMMFKPHLLHLQIQHTSILDAPTIERVKKQIPDMIVTNWTGDVRNNIPHTYKRIADVCDYNFISSTGQLGMFNSGIGKDKKVRYWQIGYNPKLYYPLPNQEKVNLKYDAAFIGHTTKKESYPGANTRLEACNILRNTFGNRFVLFGNGWPRNLKSKGSVEQRSVSRVYHQAVAPISISHYNDLEHYFSDRLLMCLASGRPTIALKFPNYESYFTHMSDIVIVDKVSEIPDAINMLKNNTELASYIGQSGAAKVLAEHSYYSRVKELLNVVGLI